MHVHAYCRMSRLSGSYDREPSNSTVPLLTPMVRTPLPLITATGSEDTVTTVTVRLVTWSGSSTFATETVIGKVVSPDHLQKVNRNDRNYIF